MEAVGFDRGTPAISDSMIDALTGYIEYDRLFPETFTLTGNHVAAIRKMHLDWGTAEVGAPCLSPDAPYGDQTTMEMLAELLGDVSEQEQVDFLISLPCAIRDFCQKATLTAGSYDTVDGPVVVTEDHLKLVPELSWYWPNEDDMFDVINNGDIGGPEVDPKRPYGDMSFYQLDIHRALGWPIEAKNDDGFIELTEAQIEAGSVLHADMLGVTRAFFAHAKVELEK